MQPPSRVPSPPESSPTADTLPNQLTPVTTAATVPSGQPPPPGAPEASEWRVGTLSYSRRGLVRLFSWLLWGDFAWAVRDRSLGDVLKLLLKKFEASNTVIGLLSQTAPAAIGFFLGPVISYRSDRFRSGWGRRRLFLLASAPVAAVAIIGLGFSPVLGQALHGALGSHSPGAFPSVLIVLALWWIVFDFAATVTNSVFSALINDVVPHGVIGRFYGLFRMVSLLVGIVFNYWLLEKTKIHYQFMFVVIGAIYGIGVVSMCLQVQEGEYPPPPPAQQGGGLRRFFLAAWGYLRDCFSKPYYLWYFGAVNLATASISPVNGYTIIFADSLGMSTSTYGKYIAATYTISLCITYGVSTLVDRFHPLRMSMIVMALYGTACLWGGIFARSQGTYAVALLAHGVISGLFWTSSLSLGQRMLPKATFAQFASASGLIGAVINIVLPLLLGRILDYSGNNYRITFLLGSGMSYAALGCLLVVYGYWRRYGGPHHFVAPE